MRPVDADKLIEEGYVLTKHGISNCVITTKSIADVPTLDEKEIIRRYGEKIVYRLKEASFPRSMGNFTELVVLKNKAIDIVKGVCDIENSNS
jgi:hypothetical protein